MDKQTGSPIVECQVQAVFLQEDKFGQQDLCDGNDKSGQHDRPAARTSVQYINSTQQSVIKLTHINFSTH